MTTKTTTARKLRWTAGKFTEGPFKGPFWGARLGETFLMIVPRSEKKATDRHHRGALTFELWTDGVVHDETQSATLDEAKAFAERSLGNILSGKFPAKRRARKAA